MARLVLCSIIEGNAPRIEHDRRVFRKLFHDAEGMLAGRRGNLADTIDQLADESRGWSFPADDAHVHTFALNARRNKVLPTAVDVGAVQWSHKLFSPIDQRQAERDRTEIRPDRRQFRRDRRRMRFERRRMQRHGRPREAPLSFYPVVFGDMVLLNDSERIYAWNLFSGKPAWPIDTDDTAVIYPAIEDETPRQPKLPTAGVPRYTMTVHEGRLYARMGSPVTNRARNEMSDLANELVCLDLARGEGKLVWRISADAERAGWAFEGSPVVSDGRVYVAQRRSRPQTQLNVACFDAETGKRIWNRNVCAVVGDFDVGRNSVSHHLLTLVGNHLFYSTDTGAIASLDARDGMLRWVVTYESQKRERFDQARDTRRQGLKPCLVHQGIVVAAPNDFDGLMALDAATGRLKWQRSLRGGVRHLLGVGQGKLIVSGKRLWGLDLFQGGRIVWQRGFEDPAGDSYGRGVLAEDVVYWPMREEIFVVHQETGAVRRRIALKALHGETGGNLTLANGMMLVAQSNRLVAFSEYAGLKKRLRDAVSAAPTSALPYYRLAEIEQVTGNRNRHCQREVVAENRE